MYSKVMQDVRCTKVVPYEEEGKIYLDWWGKASCDFGEDVTIHIPKMDSGFKEINVVEANVEDYSFASSLASIPRYLSRIKKECFVSNDACCNDVFYEIYDPDSDKDFNSYDEHIELCSDDKEWADKEAHYYILRGYKVIRKTYLNKIYYYDLEKE